MNKIFKTVWNKTRNCYVVVSEANKTFGKGKVKALSVLALAIATAFPCSVVYSKTTLPTAPDVTWNPGIQFWSFNAPLTEEHVYDAVYRKKSVVPEINDPTGVYGFSSITDKNNNPTLSIKKPVTVKTLYLFNFGNSEGENKSWGQPNYSELGHDSNHDHWGYHHFEGPFHAYGDVYTDTGTELDIYVPLVVFEDTVKIDGSLVAQGEFFFKKGLKVNALFHSWEVPDGIFVGDSQYKNKFGPGQDHLSHQVDLNVIGDLDAGEIYSRSRINVTGTTTVANEFETEGELNTNDLILKGESQNRGEIYVKNNLTVDQSLTQTAGSLKFDKSSNVFSDLGHYDYVPLQVIGVEAEAPEQVQSVTSENYKKLVSGILNGEFADKVSVNGGKVVINNTNLTNEQMEDLKRIFKQKYAGAELEFGSNTVVDYTSNTVLNVATVNKLYEEKSDFQNKTFVAETLKGEGKDVTVGDSDGNLKHSTGFKGIDNATSITVNDGKSLELVGEKGEEPSFLMTAVKTVVNAASKLVLGSKGLSETYSGKTKEVELSDTNATLLAAAGIYEVEKVTGNGKVEVDKGAKLALDGAEHTGSVEVKGTLNVKAEANLGNTTLEGGSELVNSGNLHLTNLSSTDSSTYRQTGGSLKTDAGWFNNATLYISGGKIDMADIAGGIYNDTGLGSNTIEVSGQKDFPLLSVTDPQETRENWQEGMTVLKAGKVTSETKVTLKRGGVLDVEKLEFDGTQDTIVLDGGAIQTSLDQIFDDVYRDSFYLDQEAPGNNEHLHEQVTGATNVGKIKDNVLAGIQGSSGLVVFDDPYIKTKGMMQAVANFRAEASNPGSTDPTEPPADRDHVYLGFTGKLDAKADVDLVNEFEKEAANDHVEGAVFYQTPFYNEQSGHDSGTYKDLEIGEDSAKHGNANFVDAKNELGIGFSQLIGADNLYIEAGKEFALVGQNDTRPEDQRGYHVIPDTELFTEANALMKDAKDGGVIHVEDGKFVMGSFASNYWTVGWVGKAEVGDSGKLDTKYGEFMVAEIENRGMVSTEIGSVLHTKNYHDDEDAVMENFGSLFVGNHEAEDHDFRPVELLSAPGEEEHSHRSGKMEINGRFHNNAGAILNTSGTDMVFLNKELTNDGYAYHNEMSIAAGASDTNNFFEQGERLQVKESGNWSNTNTAEWAEFSVETGGKAENKGYLKIGDIDDQYAEEEGELAGLFTVAGDFTNTSALDATKAASSVARGGNLVNRGQAAFGTLTDDGGVITLESQTSIKELVLNDGTTYIKSGETAVDAAQFNGASLVVGNEQQAGGENVVIAGFVTESPIGTAISVVNNGDLRFGLTAGDAIAALETDNGIPRFALSGHITLTETGSLSVGTAIARETLSGGSMRFEGDSYTVLDMKDAQFTKLNSGDLPSESFFSTEAVGATLSVSDGAKLVLARLMKPGRYLITDGFANLNDESGDWIGGWSDENLSSGTLEKLWDLTLQHDEDSVWVDAKLRDVRTQFPDIALPNNVNDDLQNYCGDPGAGPDAKFLCGVMHDEMLPDKEKKKIVDSVGNLGTVGGIMNGAYNDANQATNSAEDRASALGDVFGSDGFYREVDDNDPPLPGEDGGDHYRIDEEGKGIDGNGDDGGDRYRINEEKNGNASDGNEADGSENGKDRDKKKDGEGSTRNNYNKYRGNNLWVDILGGLRWADNMKATGMSFGYKGHSYGAVMGYDHVFYDWGTMAGVALSFDNGQLKSTGETLPTTNKYKTYGLQLYGGWKAAEHLNFIGALGYFRSRSDITMGLNAAAGFNKATAKADTDLLTVSTRIEFPFRFRETGVVVPHIGLRYVLGKTEDYWTKLDGQKAFKNSPKATNTFQIPVGVGFREDFRFDNGWRVRPKADVSVIPQFGTKQKTTVTGITNAIDDNVKGDFTGKIGVAYSMGVQADRKNWTIGANFGVTGGNHGQMDVNAKLEARLRF